MKKLLFILLSASTFLLANPCKDLPADQKEACKANRLNSIKSIESNSHQSRIGILNAADSCIKGASTKEAYKACEQKEKSDRQSLKTQIKSQKQAIRNQ